MAIAGRSYPSVPVISRGSLEDPDDFIAKVMLVVTSQPSQAQTATQPATVLRSTLADPPVLTTPAPVVIAAPADRRWFTGAAVTVRGTLADPPVLTTPGPVVVTSQPAASQTATPPVLVFRSTLQDPPVLTTAAPVVIAAPADPRWFGASPVQVLTGKEAPAVTPVSAPGPLVITSQPPVLPAVPAFITRGTLADPPVLTTPGPVIAAGPPDPRWFAARPALVLAGAAAPAPLPVLFSAAAARQVWGAPAARQLWAARTARNS